MTGRTGKWLRVACATATVALVAAGCSSGGGTSTTTAASLPKYGQAEKTTLNVGVVPAMDSAGFFVAMNEGLFAKEGLTINYTPETSSETAISSQESGQLDISGGNYVSYIDAVALHAAPLEIIAEGSIMTPGAQVIYTPGNSDIKALSQLKGKTIAVNAPDNIDFLLDEIVLSGYGIKVNNSSGYNSSEVNFPADPIAFPTMAGVVAKDGSPYAAATLPEPFASQAEQQNGMVPLVDLDQGAAQQFPIEGYVVTKQWAEKNPNTLDRFLAALEEGQDIADTNRKAVEQAFENIKASPGSQLPAAAFGQVPASIASVMALNTYPIGIDQTRIQRVADVMYQFNLLPKRFDVSSMILPSSQFNFAPFAGGSAS
jgi:NitT/TauT family transport system substrate-binding protein